MYVLFSSENNLATCGALSVVLAQCMLVSELLTSLASLSCTPAESKTIGSNDHILHCNCETEDTHFHLC